MLTWRPAGNRKSDPRPSAGIKNSEWHGPPSAGLFRTCLLVPPQHIPFAGAHSLSDLQTDGCIRRDTGTFLPTRRAGDAARGELRADSRSPQRRRSHERLHPTSMRMFCEYQLRAKSRPLSVCSPALRTVLLVTLAVRLMRPLALVMPRVWLRSSRAITRPAVTGLCIAAR